MLDTIYRAGQVLQLLSTEKTECGVTEVAEALGVSKSTAHTLLTSLCKTQLVRRTDRKRYRLGWGILALARALMESTEVRVEALPVMEELVQRFGETIHLAVLDGFEVVYMEKREGTRAVAISASAVGSRLPAHCSGVGKVLLADRPWNEVRALIPSTGLPRFTPNTITTAAELAEELKRVREQGYAYDNEEAIPEICCVAAPLRDHTGSVVAAISISVPAYRFSANRERYKREILAAARRISENMGYFPSARGRSGVV